MNPLLLREFLTLEESAELVAGEKPSSKEDLRRWAEYKSHMKKAMEDHIKMGTLVPDASEEVVSKPHYSFIHNREYGGGHRTTVYGFRPVTILAWCEEIGYRSKYLFPEKPPADRKEDPREINTLLELIYLVTKLQYGDLGHPFRVADEIIKDAAKQGEPVFLERKAIADKVKKALEKHNQSNRTNR